jgi:hypothetical protein
VFHGLDLFITWMFNVEKVLMGLGPSSWDQRNGSQFRGANNAVEPLLWEDDPFVPEPRQLCLVNFEQL